jgi:hypothetical protein
MAAHQEASNAVEAAQRYGRYQGLTTGDTLTSEAGLGLLYAGIATGSLLGSMPMLTGFDWQAGGWSAWCAAHDCNERELDNLKLNEMPAWLTLPTT